MYTPDGKEGYNITCSGSSMNWGMCYEKAGDICGPKGYEVLQKNSDEAYVYGGSLISRNIIIKCKE
jgi:hypothetical protein